MNQTLPEMNARELLSHLARRQVELYAEGDMLRFRMLPGAEIDLPAPPRRWNPEPLTITVRSGEIYDVAGYSDDVGGRIHVLDATLGEIDLKWERIETIEFMPAPRDAARRAAGAVVAAVDLVLGGEATCAFCAVRPPGPHAERAAAMGCCFFNNIAVGAAHALTHYGLQRIAIVDFDVHHGNGTEDIFHNEPRVLFCSSFQHPFFPHSDIGAPGAHIGFAIGTP